MQPYLEPDTPIADLQRYLRLVSTVYPTVPEVAQDGIYDAQTALAVREFQRANDRDATGIVDYDTWELLRVTYELITLLNSTPVRGVDFPADYTAKLGEEGEYPLYIAIMLNRIAENFDNIPSVETSGKYDKNTENSIKEFQRVAGLETTGETDKRTWTKLSDVYASYM